MNFQHLFSKVISDINSTTIKQYEKQITFYFLSYIYLSCFVRRKFFITSLVHHLFLFIRLDLKMMKKVSFKFSVTSFRRQNLITYAKYQTDMCRFGISVLSDDIIKKMFFFTHIKNIIPSYNSKPIYILVDDYINILYLIFVTNYKGYIV